MQEGKFSVNGFLKRFGKRMRRLQWMISAVWRIIAPVDGIGGVIFVVCLPALQLFLFWMATFGGIDGTRRQQLQKRRYIAIGGVRFVGANTNGERPTGY